MSILFLLIGLNKAKKKLQNQTCYLRRKVKSLQTELEKCKKDMSAESFQIISEQAAEIPSNLLQLHMSKAAHTQGHCTQEYNDVIKKFAISLRLKSRSAYRYIRQCFGDALPHERTIQRWCSKVDASPGFSRPSLDHLANLVSQSKVQGDQYSLSDVSNNSAYKKIIYRLNILIT